MLSKVTRKLCEKGNVKPLWLCGSCNHKEKPRRQRLDFVWHQGHHSKTMNMHCALFHTETEHGAAVGRGQRDAAVSAALLGFESCRQVGELLRSVP